MAYAGRACDQFSLRFPEGMRERIKTAAKKNGRSMNSEIIHQLACAYSVAKQETGEEFADTAPVSMSNNAALVGGASITPNKDIRYE